MRGAIRPPLPLPLLTEAETIWQQYIYICICCVVFKCWLGTILGSAGTKIKYQRACFFTSWSSMF